MASTHAFDPDPLGDICPECDDYIRDDEEWTRVLGRLYHVRCIEPESDAASTTRKGTNG